MSNTFPKDSYLPNSFVCLACVFQASSFPGVSLCDSEIFISTPPLGSPLSYRQENFRGRVMKEDFPMQKQKYIPVLKPGCRHLKDKL